MEYSVNALTVYDGKLIAGGAFWTAGGVAASRIASWNGSNWSSLGFGMNHSVSALTVYDGKLIAGGYFSTIGGVTANYIASWDGYNWSPLGSGMENYVSSLTVYDGKLIAGGWFTTAGGVEAICIASWDGSSWSPLGSGMNGSVNDLTVYNGKLIAGGEFWTAGGVAANYIASWDGSSWSPLGSGMEYSVFALAVYDGKLIAGGNFTTAGGVTANYIASWDGSSWSPLGSGMNGSVYALTVYDGKLIAGGEFATAGGVAAICIASWDGSSWSPLGSGMEYSVYALAVYDGKLIAGGNFLSAGGVAAYHIASWDGSSWSPLGSGMNREVSALTVYDEKLIAGGWFIIAGNEVSAYLATYYEDPLLVTNLGNSGTGSLRFTIDSANSNPGPDTITFSVSGTIALSSPLPAFVDDSAVILGSTAPGGAHSVILDGAGLTTCNGLVVQSCNNKIEGLTIRNFPGSGIEVSGALSVNNTLTNNLIYNNANLAIDLNNDGVTPNDLGDLDTGPNNLVNYPVHDTSWYIAPDSTFSFNGHAAKGSFIEFYVAHPANDNSRPADPSGYGEAYSYIGADTCDEFGGVSFLVPKTVSQFSLITAIATDTLGNTSEFCPNIAITPSPLIIVAYSPVNLWITDPDGYYIGKDSVGSDFQTITSASYDEVINDSITIFNPILGHYLIEVIPEVGAPPGATYTIGIRIDGTEQAIMTLEADVPASGTRDTANYNVEEGYHFKNGDANDNGIVNIQDITFLINYLYKQGPAPYPVIAGDANCDGTVNIRDITYLINYLYKQGPAPCQM
jgi:hypothetical protein